LIDLFRARAAQAFPQQRSADGFVIGMVGYPNVGKSSTINRLLGAKKTSVSATPGKTKHFQTIIIDEQVRF
jgi:large subunit GTPase 1